MPSDHLPPLRPVLVAYIAVPLVLLTATFVMLAWHVATAEPGRPTAMLALASLGAAIALYCVIGLRQVKALEARYAEMATTLQAANARLEARVNEQELRQALEVAKAEELARLKDDIFSSISHETRTPLALILGYTELLQERYPEDDLLIPLLAGGRRLAQHLTNVLDCAAMLGGNLVLYQVEADLAEIIGGVADMLREDVDAKGLALELEVPAGLPPLLVDSHRVTQMLVALVGNAIKFTPPGGRIGVRAGLDGSDLVLHVWDTGPGVSEGSRASIWEAFHQVDAGNVRAKGGTGLGLTIARQVALMHGGRIELAATGPDGSTFAVWLPTIRPAVPASTIAIESRKR